MIDFKKAYATIDSETLEITIQAMNFGEILIDMIKLLYVESKVVIVINDIKGKQFKTKGGVKQGHHLRPYLLITAL